MVALSAATPQWLDIGGRRIQTSIVRSPTAGPLAFGPEGPEGNLTAVHTEQVLAFSAANYDYWSDRLKVSRDAWDWCHWGENLVLSWLDENTVRVGDRLQIGDAVFEATSPRVPCFKLAWRLGQPESVLPLLMQSGLIGVYLRVVRPGAVTTGDTVHLTAIDPEAITVGGLSRMMAEPAREDLLDQLKAAAALPALGGQLAAMTLRRINRLEDAARLKIGRWRGWRAFKVAGTRDETGAIKSFDLVAEDGAPLAPFNAGQFLTVRLDDDPAAAAASRAWSLSDYQPLPDRYRLTVKAHGRGSRWLHGLAEGSIVKVKPPAGRFTLDRSSFRRIVLISAGIGVTPMLAMLKAHAERNPAARPPLTWIEVARDGAARPLAAETDRWLATDPAFQRQVHLTRPTTDDRLGVDYDRAGRLTEDDLIAYCRAPYGYLFAGRRIELPGFDNDVYICGPPDFEAMVRESLVRAGVDAALIRAEAFIAPAGAARPGAVETAKITFLRAGTTALWRAQDDLTLLDFAETLGLTPDFGCRMGVCNACDTAFRDGEVCYDAPPGSPPAPGRALICRARPASATLSLDL